MAQINRETVVRSFSIARMADDAEALYARVLPGKSAQVQIVVGGYYGYGNCGDETLLSEMIRALRAEIPGAAITVLSADPKGTRLRCGTRAIYRYDPAVITELKKADLYLCGGGSLLTDRPSQRSLRSYVGMMALAKKLGCRVMLYAAGVGPFDSAKGSELAAKALRSADAITLRDAASCALAKEIAPEISPILTDDPAMALEPMSGFEAEFLLDRLKLSRGECFALAPRSIPNGTEDWERTLAQTIDAIRTKTGKTPLFLVMQEDRDRALCNRIAQICGGRVLPKLSGREVAAVLSACAFSLPMRLHAAILSLKAGTKLHCISYDPKTDAFCEEHAIPFTRAEQIGRLAEDAKRGNLSFSLGDCFAKEAGRSNPAAAAAALLKEAGAK
jgi:polysaccharide pyruvyl transferase CsaB